VVDQCRSIETILGDGHKSILPDELSNAKKLRYWQKYWPTDVCEQ